MIKGVNGKAIVSSWIVFNVLQNHYSIETGATTTATSLRT